MSLFCRAHYFVFFGGLEINIGDAEIQKKSKEGNKKKRYTIPLIDIGLKQRRLICHLEEPFPDQTPPHGKFVTSFQLVKLLLRPKLTSPF